MTTDFRVQDIIAIVHGSDSDEEVILAYYLTPDEHDWFRPAGDDQSIERAASLADSIGLTQRSGPDSLGTSVWVRPGGNPDRWLRT